MLVVALGRVNAADSSNNGLLLRNLFGHWPREKLAQVFSSGDNDDSGYFGRYYKLGTQDRRLGTLFYRLKTDASATRVSKTRSPSTAAVNRSSLVAQWVKRLPVDTGFYELIFAPRLSWQMQAWIKDFGPDVVFAQGYNLTFTWLPLIVSEHSSIPLCYYPTDDWPSDLYRSGNNMTRLLNWPARRAVTRSSRELARRSVVRVAFNPAMQEAYSARYQVPFAVLMHGDDAERFAAATPKRMAAHNEFWIVGTGVFDRHRWPLLRDFDRACDILAAAGLRVRATIFPVNSPRELAVRQEQFRHIEFVPCPGHEDLPAILRGADALFLPERFDETVEDIKLCVSSKAHLFMFSGKPIVVYSALGTGLAQYARRSQWAILVDQRNPKDLASAFQRIAEDDQTRQTLIFHARHTARQYHDLAAIQRTFLDMLSPGARYPADV